MGESNDIVTKESESAISGDEQLFLGLFTTHRYAIYAYILAITGHKDSADDVFQETSIFLWKEFHRFEPGTNFLSWAKAVAYNRVREYRRKRSNDKLVFTDNLMDSLEQESENLHDVFEQRWSVLSSCVGGMSEKNISLFKDFYAKKMTAQQLADELGRSIFAIRKSIHKIRKFLFDCVDKKQGEEE